MTATSTTPTNLANSNAELRALWSLRERHRADGGWWSLSGFSIQTTIALERFVRRAIVEGRPDAYAFEAVSDFSTTGEKVCLTQVKRTLTRSTLAAAVSEARTVLDLCSPEFAEKVEFQIVCERDEAGLKPSDLKPSEVFDNPAATTADLSRVLARFNPSAAVKVTSNPGLSLRRTLLSAGVRDPDRVARDALGTLFDAFDGRNRDGVDAAVMRALSDIRESARIEDIVPGRLLTAEEFEPVVNAGRRLFIGARPRLSDLVKGRFLERAEALPPLVEVAKDWLSGLDQSYADDDLRLPVLWLEGRPGDGKSILTLQLLRHLVVTLGRLSSVAELASADELSRWMTTAAYRDANNQAEIGFIDDLAGYVDRRGLDALIDKAFYRGSPYVGLITCGTTEDGALFKASRRVALTAAKIGRPSTSDLEALRRWAQDRLGRKLSGTHVDGTSISDFVVSLTLEESHQPRARSGPSDSLRTAMAVNALGLGAPRSLVDDIEVLTYAAERPDIELSPMEETSGVRLAHAEAIWRLYVDAAGEAELAGLWGSDLGRALAIRASNGESTEARTLLGELINTKQASSRLRRYGSHAPNTTLLDAVFHTFTDGSSLQSGAPLLRLWLVAALNGRLAAIDAATLREEGRQILAVESISEDIKSEVAAALILIGRVNDSATRAAASFLKGAGPVPAAAKYALNALSKDFQGQTAEVAISWLIKNRRDPAIGDVLGRVLNNRAPLKLQDLGFEYVKRFMGRPESGPVLTALRVFGSTKQFHSLQDEWLAQSNDAPRALGIYRDQLQSARWRQFADRALAFIKMHPDIRGGQAILSLLLRKRSGDPEVLAAARGWLDHSVDLGVATPVLTELVAIRPLDAADLERALQHVNRAAPGSTSLFATLAVVLQASSPPDIAILRSRLPRRLVGIFDQARSRRFPTLTGRLKILDDRLRRQL